MARAVALTPLDVVLGTFYQGGLKEPKLIEVTKMQCIRAKNSEEKRKAIAQQTGGA
jgi:hypothetical protein